MITRVSAWAAETQGSSLRPYEFTIDGPEDHEVVVEAVACGICHFDIHSGSCSASGAGSPDRRSAAARS